MRSILSGSWDIDSFNETGLNYGFGQIPMLKKGDTPYAPGSIDPAFGINNKISGDKLKAAEKFFTFLTSDEGLKLYQKQLGLIPSVKGFNATVDDHFKDAYDLRTSRPANVYLNSAHWSKGTTRAARRDLHPAAAGSPRLHQPYAGRGEPRFQAQDPLLIHREQTSIAAGWRGPFRPRHAWTCQSHVL
ncbi:MAG: extracellular solute-binding protein [Bifidobacterium bifidum]